MTPAERALARLRPVIGERWTDRIRSNLPSRKPQLWEGLARSVFRRTQRMVNALLDKNWSKRTLIVRLRDSDLVMELRPDNEDIDLPIIQFGLYEVSGTRFVQSFLEPGMVFVDVGANSGYFSLIASRLVGPSGFVYALEPADTPFSKLGRNIALNGIANVTAIKAAAGKASGRSLLYSSSTGRNDGLGSLLPGPSRDARGSEVQVLTLDEVGGALRRGKVDLIKVDVEGTEQDVLAGGEALLSGPRSPAILLESFNVQPTFALLMGLGYDVRHIHFSLARGLEFPRVGDPFDNCFASYEPPSFVALKSLESCQTFESLAAKSKLALPGFLRFLAELA